MSAAAKTRVLIVDDSVVMRRHLADIIGQDVELTVVGAVANGRLALRRIEGEVPDIVTLDVEMPEMDGLQTLREIRARWPRLPVIMCSARTERGGAATLDALAAGANDYVAKPSNATESGNTSNTVTFAAEFVQKIRALTGRSRSGLVPSARSPVPIARIAAPVTSARAPARRKARIEIVAIGCSTGGPNALAEVLPALPADFPVPIVIVQHMPALFTKLLADRLSRSSRIQVSEAAPAQLLTPGHAYVAPGDFHLEVLRSGASVETLLHKGAQENSCRPAVDVLFRSVVGCYGAAVLGVVLTGMGQDGLRGCELIASTGGQVVAQDEQSSVVWGMPGFVTEAGLADEVRPLGEIASAIIRLVGMRPGERFSDRSKEQP